MLIQILLNFLSGLITSWIAGLPALPEGLTTFLAGAHVALGHFEAGAVNFGAVVPFNTATTIVRLWVAVMFPFWLAMASARVILKALGR